jgi:hypothetical protein
MILGRPIDMKNTDSVYLYSKDQKKLYGNVLESLEHRKCPHTHTVYALMDVEEHELTENMVNHVSSCKECQKVVTLSQAVTGRVDQLIPDFETTAPEALSSNLRAMLQRSEYSTSSKTKNRIRQFSQSLLANGLDVLSVIFSVKMGLTYVAALFLGLFLNWIF